MIQWLNTSNRYSDAIVFENFSKYYRPSNYYSCRVGFDHVCTNVVSHHRVQCEKPSSQCWTSWILDRHKNDNFVRDHPTTIHVWKQSCL